MNLEVKEQILIDEWRGLYRDSWKGVICDESFAHPAKFSRALIQHIYEHVIEEGWATKGSSVIDPFGGVALGAFPAMQHGLTWIGCELEEKFVALGSQNIALWNDRYSRMPNWGSAHLLQGDSRKLIEVLSAAECCVSSPPYADGCRQTGGEDPKPHYIQSGNKDVLREYGETAGQLGSMKEGDHSLVVSSPPYAQGLNSGGCRGDKHDKVLDAMRSGYGKTEGQLGAMPEGQLCVTSPPYNPPMSQDHNGTRGGSRGTTPSEKGAFAKYGNTEGQLEGMSMDGFAAAISSPPFESSTQVNNTPGDITEGRARWEGGTDSAARVKQDYADYASEGNLGNMRGGFDAAISSPPYEGSLSSERNGIQWEKIKPDYAGRQWHKDRVSYHNDKHSDLRYSPDEQNLGNQRGETFWSASRIILEQLHQVIVPGGHAVFVVKAFVRDKKIVDFPAQWAQLCEAVGFRLLHDHHALLTEHYGTQGGFDEDKKLSVERKSFFRRLAESKGSPRIDHENVLCFERP